MSPYFGRFLKIVSLSVLPKEAKSHYFEDFCLSIICVDFPPLNDRKITENLPCGNGHNFQERTTLLKTDEIVHF